MSRFNVFSSTVESIEADVWWREIQWYLKLNLICDFCWLASFFTASLLLYFHNSCLDNNLHTGNHSRAPCSHISRKKLLLHIWLGVLELLRFWGWKELWGRLFEYIFRSLKSLLERGWSIILFLVKVTFLRSFLYIFGRSMWDCNLVNKMFVLDKCFSNIFQAF